MTNSRRVEYAEERGAGGMRGVTSVDKEGNRDSLKDIWGKLFRSTFWIGLGAFTRRCFGCVNLSLGFDIVRTGRFGRRHGT